MWGSARGTTELQWPAYLPPTELPSGPELHVLSKGSERRLPGALGEVGVEAGEQESDGTPRSAKMVEPAEGERGMHEPLRGALGESVTLLEGPRRERADTAPPHSPAIGRAHGRIPERGPLPCPSSRFPPTNWKATSCSGVTASAVSKRAPAWNPTPTLPTHPHLRGFPCQRTKTPSSHLAWPFQP